MSKQTSKLVGINFVFSIIVGATDSPRAAYSTEFITPAQWTKILSDVKSQPGMRCQNHDASQLICGVSSLPMIWIFTRATHPAHPAASKGVMIFCDGRSILIGSAFMLEIARAFFEWMEAFVILDARQIESWKNSGVLSAAGVSARPH